MYVRVIRAMLFDRLRIFFFMRNSLPGTTSTTAVIVAVVVALVCMYHDFLQPDDFLFIQKLNF